MTLHIDYTILTLVYLLSKYLMFSQYKRVWACLAFFLLSPLSYGQTSNPIQHYQRGVENNQTGNLVEATIIFTEVISAFPNFADVYFQRGLSFIGMGRIDHGLQDFESAVMHGVKTPTPYRRLIAEYTKQQQPLKVIQIANQLLINLPDQAAVAHYEKGLALENLSNASLLQLSIKSYESSIQLIDDKENADFKKMIQNKVIKLKSK